MSRRPARRAAWRRALLATALVAGAHGAATAHPHDPDWAQRARYRDANAALAQRPADPARIVFMGDSITEGWAAQADGPFASPQALNRGISGQTTAQMLVRFRADVLALKPRVVVLLAGTNDLAGNTGPVTVDEVAGNIRSMLQLARAEGVAVVLCAVLPVKRYSWAPAVQPVPLVAALNRQLQALAQEFGAAWVDYYAALADADGGLPAAYSGDGVHPNAAGYAVMRRLVEPAIAAQLRRGAR